VIEQRAGAELIALNSVHSYVAAIGIQMVNFVLPKLARYVVLVAPASVFVAALMSSLARLPVDPQVVVAASA